MKNACFVGFCAVAFAMTTGCMAEVMDEPLAEESQAAVTRYSPESCVHATADATFSFPYSLNPIRTSADSASTYGSTRCPGWYVADLEFDSQYWSNGRSYDASVLTSPTTQAACNDTWLAVDLYEANLFYLPYPDPDCTGLFCPLLPGRPGWALRRSANIKGQWNPSEGCFMKINFNERAIARFGSRIVVKAYRGSNPSSTRSVTVTANTRGF